MELLTTNNVWMMICTALVFFMHLGFSFLEIGLTRQKNTINILFKNFFVITMGLIVYCGFGFNIIYPGEFGIIDGILGFAGPGLDPGVDYDQLSYADGGYTYWTDFLFQGMFAATAATIISGAVAERIKISAFMLIAFLYVSIVYPIVGSWQWGGGFFSDFISDDLGFYDFAGSTLVHSVGGWAALTGALIIGPRIGKYGPNGEVNAIPGSNLPLATIGTFILWFGWFGFNGGSQLALGTAADAAAIANVYVNTNMAACAGLVAALALSMLLYKKTDLTFVLNGALAGLVAITAGPDVATPLQAMIIGAIGGVLTTLAIPLLDKIGIDDVVGAISVHLVSGIWGTLAVAIPGLNGSGDIGTQVIGILAIGIFTVILSGIGWFVLKAIYGLRPSEEEENIGLDISELGMDSYPEFKK